MARKNINLTLLFILLIELIGCKLNNQNSLSNETGEKVDALFGHIQQDEPGYIVAVIKDDVLVYKKGFGQANLDYEVPMTSKSAFYMGSTSKQFTAACLLALVEQKKVTMDDDIRVYLPEMPDYGSEITLRHLLHHTSGIREYTSLLLQTGIDRQWESKFNNEVVYELLCQQSELNFKPGTRYLYSSSGYILLTKIIERVSGFSLRQFADSTLFKPLGMNNTYFTDNYQEVIPNRVSSYRQSGDSYHRIVKIFDIYGDGGLISTLEDLTKWDKAFYSDNLGIVDFGKKMSQNGTLLDGHEINYAWALQKHDYHGLPMIEHGGFMINFESSMMRFPDQKLTVIVLSNCWRNREVGAMNLSYEISNIYLSPLIEEKQGTTTSRSTDAIDVEFDDFTGSYWNIHQNYFNVIGQSENNLFYKNRYGWQAKLIPESSNTFAIEGTDQTIQFENDRMILTNPLANNLKQYFKKFDPSPPLSLNELYKYRGIFYSKELDTTYEFIIDANTFLLKINNNPARQIYPAIDDVIWNSKSMVWIGFAEIEFTYDPLDQVTGFFIGDNRVRGVRFEKMD